MLPPFLSNCHRERIVLQQMLSPPPLSHFYLQECHPLREGASPSACHIRRGGVPFWAVLKFRPHIGALLLHPSIDESIRRTLRCWLFLTSGITLSIMLDVTCVTAIYCIVNDYTSKKVEIPIPDDNNTSVRR